jgi:hypothetical protein
MSRVMPQPLPTPVSRPTRPHGPYGLPAALACLLLAASAFLAGAARAEKGVNEGVYQDRDGGQHRWSIERSHLLVWDGKPYAPAGVVFRSAYLREPNAAALRKDQEELDRLRSAGIQDIWIDSDGLLQNGVEQTQALIDAVESRGFRYGLRVGDHFREPLVGFSPLLSPVQVPVSRLQSGAFETWEVPAPGSRRVLYTLVQSSRDQRTQQYPVASGEAIVEGETARIEVQLKNSRFLGQSRGLLHVVPEIQVEPEELGSFGDLWAGMEDYAGRLRRHLQAVKFGPGLRFILDPFVAGDGTVGREDQVFPSSDSFRQAFRDWMAKRTGVHTVNTSWRLNDTRRLQSLDEAARLVPTWPRNDPPDGDGWLLDPVDRVAYRCIPRQCSIWTDLDNFRADTLKRWMNVTAVSIKQDGPGVPVLFTWAAYHPIFNNSPSPLGYDGLGAHLYGAAAGIARETAAYALAQAEESDRNTWLIAARLAGPAGPGGEGTALSEGNAARSLWQAIREVGFRGAYFDPEQTPNAASLAKGLESTLASETEELRKPVPVCFFPTVMATADRVTRLPNGVWWIPSGAPARMLRYGDSILGYEMTRPLGGEHPVQKGTVLWSTVGKQEVTFYVDRFARVALYDSAGTALEVKPKKNALKVVLSESPIVAAGVDVEAIFPLELAAAQLRTFAELLQQAEAQKEDVASMRVIYDQARKNLAVSNAAAVYNSISPYVDMLREALMPFLWLEGERPVNHNLSGVSFQAGASAGTYLKLDRGDPPVTGVYRALYAFDIRRDASYEIWVAGRVPGRPGVSSLVWQIDDEPAVPVSRAEAVGPDYAGGMAWFSLGRVTLRAGRHELILAVPHRADGPHGRFSAGFDAVVLSRGPFRPNGSEKPVHRAPAAPRPETEARGKTDG